MKQRKKPIKMARIYICSKIAEPFFLRLFRVNHLFILDNKGNRYEVQERKKTIRIRRKKLNLRRLLGNRGIDYRIVRIPVKTFLKRLRRAIYMLNGNPYKLFTRNCYTFVKMVLYPISSFSIGLLGNLR